MLDARFDYYDESNRRCVNRNQSFFESDYFLDISGDLKKKKTLHFVAIAASDPAH